MQKPRTGSVTELLARVGMRTKEEVHSQHACELGGTAAVGAAMLVALPVGTMAFASVLRETSLAPSALPLAATLMVGQLGLVRQLGRSAENSPGLPGFLGRALAAMLMLGAAATAAVRLPEHLFVRQTTAHAQAMKERQDREERAARQHEQEVSRHRQDLQDKQAGLARLERQSRSTQARLLADQLAIQQCQERLQVMRASLPQANDSPDYPWRLALLQGHESSCSESAAKLELRRAGATLHLTGQRDLVATAQAAFEAAQQAMTQQHAQASQRRAREMPDCWSAVPSCSLQAAVASGHLQSWQAWGASLLAALLTALPLLLRESLSPDGVAQHRRLMAVADRLERRRWAKELRQV